MAAGTRIPDDALAAAWHVTMRGPVRQRISKAKAAKGIGVARQVLSAIINGDTDRCTAAYEKTVAAERLDAALRKYGFISGGDHDDDELFDFDLVDPIPITPELVKQAAAIVLKGFPPRWALVEAGADEYDADEWLLEAREAQEERRPGWPASGLRLLTRAATRIARKILAEALEARGNDHRLRLGAMIAPSIFVERRADEALNDPFEDMTEEEIEQLAAGDFDDAELDCDE